jgi:hypothetical protein
MNIIVVTMARSMEECNAAWDSCHGLTDNFLWHEAGIISDFSRSRNLALLEASEADGDWALMLDTDERIHCDIPDQIRRDLEDTTADMIHIWASDHSYAKPRLFRLPARGHYKGPTHECWIADPGSEVTTWSGMTFAELPKTPEQYRAKAERDRDILLRYTDEHEGDPRWWYYLGDTFAGLGEADDAYVAFSTCWGLDGWDEESAWAAYRIAEMSCRKNDFKSGLRWCLNGMQRHPGMAELPWLAGYCCYHLGRYQHAIWWEHMACELNYKAAHEQRINFRHEPALWEGPYDVLRWSYLAIGDIYRASHAEKDVQLMMDRRLSRKS